MPSATRAIEALCAVQPSMGYSFALYHVWVTAYGVGLGDVLIHTVGAKMVVSPPHKLLTISARAARVPHGLHTGSSRRMISAVPSALDLGLRGSCAQVVAHIFLSVGTLYVDLFA